MNVMTRGLIDRLTELSHRPHTDPDLTLLAEAILALYQRIAHLHQDDLQAFEQIEELDRRQGPGDQ